MEQSVKGLYGYLYPFTDMGEWNISKFVDGIIPGIWDTEKDDP